MNCLSILRKLGILPRISLADMEEAETANVEHNVAEIEKAVERVKAAGDQISKVNGKLRESIQRVRSPFADFEGLVHHHAEHPHPARGAHKYD